MDATAFGLIQAVVLTTLGAVLAVGTGFVSDVRRERRERSRMVRRLGGELRGLAAILVMASRERQMPTLLTRRYGQRIFGALEDGSVIASLDWGTSKTLIQFEFHLRLFIDSIARLDAPEGTVSSLASGPLIALENCLDSLRDLSATRTFHDSLGMEALVAQTKAVTRDVGSA